MSKIDYTSCKKLLNEIHSKAYDEARISKLLKHNNCTQQELIEGLSKQAFLVKTISSKQHLSQLKSDIQRSRLNEYELALLLSVNDLSGTDEILFVIEKEIRKKNVIKKYKDQFKLAKVSMTLDIDSSGQLDFSQFLKQREEIKQLGQQLQREMAEELRNIENETFKAQEQT